jgi:hypothetical protein
MFGDGVKSRDYEMAARALNHEYVAGVREWKEPPLGMAVLHNARFSGRGYAHDCQVGSLFLPHHVETNTGPTAWASLHEVCPLLSAENVKPQNLVPVERRVCHVPVALTWCVPGFVDGGGSRVSGPVSLRIRRGASQD